MWLSCKAPHRWKHKLHGHWLVFAFSFHLMAWHGRNLNRIHWLMTGTLFGLLSSKHIKIHHVWILHYPFCPLTHARTHTHTHTHTHKHTTYTTCTQYTHTDNRHTTCTQHTHTHAHNTHTDRPTQSHLMDTQLLGVESGCSPIWSELITQQSLCQQRSCVPDSAMLKHSSFSFVFIFVGFKRN